RLSLRKGGERQIAQQSRGDSRWRVRRFRRENQEAGMETGLRSGKNWKCRRNRDRRARVSRRLQREPEHEIRSSSQLDGVRCSRAGTIQNGRRNADRQKGFGQEQQAISHATTVAAIQTTRL